MNFIGFINYSQLVVDLDKKTILLSLDRIICGIIYAISGQFLSNIPFAILRISIVASVWHSVIIFVIDKTL